MPTLHTHVPQRWSRPPPGRRVPALSHRSPLDAAGDLRRPRLRPHARCRLPPQSSQRCPRRLSYPRTRQQVRAGAVTHGEGHRSSPCRRACLRPASADPECPPSRAADPYRRHRGRHPRSLPRSGREDRSPHTRQKHPPHRVPLLRQSLEHGPLRLRRASPTKQQQVWPHPPARQAPARHPPRPPGAIPRWPARLCRSAGPGYAAAIVQVQPSTYRHHQEPPRPPGSRPAC
ncbi:Uncharacterised protein [Mycobacteroides abscessus]|nr:Uncharacterised protein [Mycobacteroides abscessus]